MPELAEVEFYRRRWGAGQGQPIARVALHAAKRIFRGTNTDALRRNLRGARLLSSEAHGKQMLFHFSRHGWLGLHLGMTGELRVEPAAYAPAPHDHLVFYLRQRALVFSDPRQFGRVRFEQAELAPVWWRELPPAVGSAAFTVEHVSDYLRRHGRAPLKAVLLAQQCFPGVGNWMADEILWRAKLHPAKRAGRIRGAGALVLWKTVRSVCRDALRIIAPQFGDPPASWLFRHRWEPGGRCPRDQTPLQRATVGGRTTAWCPLCQST
jgi:formamidopyrimidine-DNA glycosylase